MPFLPVGSKNCIDLKARWQSSVIDRNRPRFQPKVDYELDERLPKRAVFPVRPVPSLQKVQVRLMTGIVRQRYGGNT